MTAAHTHRHVRASSVKPFSFVDTLAASKSCRLHHIQSVSLPLHIIACMACHPFSVPFHSRPDGDSTMEGDAAAVPRMTGGF